METSSSLAAAVKTKKKKKKEFVSRDCKRYATLPGLEAKQLSLSVILIFFSVQRKWPRVDIPAVVRAVPYEARIVGLVINAIVVDAVSLAPVFASVHSSAQSFMHPHQIIDFSVPNSWRAAKDESIKWHTALF
jgi:hypothetical protein